MSSYRGRMWELSKVSFIGALIPSWGLHLHDQPFGTRDQFHGRQFFHGLGWGRGFRMIQEYYIYCALYLYYYYTVIYNEIIIYIYIYNEITYHNAESVGALSSISCWCSPGPCPGRLRTPDLTTFQRFYFQMQSYEELDFKIFWAVGEDTKFNL